MVDKIDKSEPSIDYPCEWIYKVIGSDKESIHNAIVSVMQDNEFRVNISNTSKTGKYLSFSLKVMVSDEAYRNKIYQDLKEHNDIKFVF